MIWYQRLALLQLLASGYLSLALCLKDLVSSSTMTHSDPLAADLFTGQAGVAQPHLLDKDGTGLINIYTVL